VGDQGKLGESRIANSGKTVQDPRQGVQGEGNNDDRGTPLQAVLDPLEDEVYAGRSSNVRAPRIKQPCLDVA
jgi:hypothetical protein